MPVSLSCTICAAPFLVKPYRAATALACSRSCRGKLPKIRRSASTATRTCKTCSSPFTILKSQLRFKGYGTFCSRACSTRWQEQVAAHTQSKTMARAKDKAWSKAVHVKDRDTCRRCGKVDKSNDAHHIAPREQFPELRFGLSNGMCVCQSCHRWIHNHPEESRDRGWLLGEITTHTCQGANRRCRQCGRFLPEGK